MMNKSVRGLSPAVMAFAIGTIAYGESKIQNEVGSAQDPFLTFVIAVSMDW